MTFEELQQTVRGNLIDLPSFVDSAVPQLINRAYRDAQRQHNFWVMRAELNAQTAIGQRLLIAVPERWKQWRGKPYYTDETGSKRRMLLMPSLDDARAGWDTDDEGEPEAIVESLSADTGTSSFLVYPLPDGNSEYPDGEYRITIPYWTYLPRLTADADSTWLTEAGEAYLEAQATKYGFAKDWDEGRATYWENQAAAEWRKLLLQDKYRQLSMTETLQTATGPYDIPRE